MSQTLVNKDDIPLVVQVKKKEESQSGQGGGVSTCCPKGLFSQIFEGKWARSGAGHQCQLPVPPQPSWKRCVKIIPCATQHNAQVQARGLNLGIMIKEITDQDCRFHPPQRYRDVWDDLHPSPLITTMFKRYKVFTSYYKKYVGYLAEALLHYCRFNLLWDFRCNADFKSWP